MSHLSLATRTLILAAACLLAFAVAGPFGATSFGQDAKPDAAPANPAPAEAPARGPCCRSRPGQRWGPAGHYGDEVAPLVGDRSVRADRLFPPLPVDLLHSAGDQAVHGTEG